MKIVAGKFAVASASVFALAGLLCALYYRTSPQGYASGANFLLHTDMYSSTRPLEWGEMFMAAAAWWMIVAAIVGASAALYNRMVRS